MRFHSSHIFRTFALPLVTATLLVGAAGISSAQQPKDEKAKPTLSSHTRALEIDIETDERLRADTRLHRTLLDEAKRLMAEQRKDADKYWRKDRSMFRHGPWTYEREYFRDAAAGPYISVAILDFIYSGGAHPNRYIETFLWNREQGKRASIASLFREAKTGGPTLKALAALIRDGVAKEKRERGVDVESDLEKDPSLSAIKPELKTMGAPSLVPSTAAGKSAGLNFHFAPYDVGAYVEGSYSAFVTWKQLEPFLTDAARAWFGGERAEGDAKEF